MTETLIAGVLFASSLTAVGRMSASALSGSKTSSHRAQIEAAINNNIQTMQKQDYILAMTDQSASKHRRRLQQSSRDIKNPFRTNCIRTTDKRNHA